MKIEFLLVSEAARELNCAASTIRRLEERGELRASRTPTGTRIFSVGDIRRLAAQREKREGRIQN
jgi:excisionase family DNA binding protein